MSTMALSIMMEGFMAICRLVHLRRDLLLARGLRVTVKFLLCVVILLNLKSIPFGWHLRVFQPVLSIRLRYLLLHIRIMGKSRSEGDKMTIRWLDSIAPMGCNPFETVVSYSARATLDECDFNLHLSNSSYAKALDPGRFLAAVRWFLHFFRVGGWVPLAATHYHFIREIPVLAPFEVRFSIAAWDDKWAYLVCRFVTKPKKYKSGGAPLRGSLETSPTSRNGIELVSPTSLRTREIESPNSPTQFTWSEESDVSVPILSFAANLIHAEEPDGAILHTVSISQVCFKYGKITVPPAIVLAMNGFIGPDCSLARSSSARNASPYSADNPPPQWDAVKSICYHPGGGSISKAREFLSGRWRDVPQGERWWVLALDGMIEEQRKTNLAALENVRKGMQAARHIVRAFC